MTGPDYIRTRETLEAQERAYLAPYAVCSAAAPHEHDEPPPRDRTHFQRDWHRITHSRAFRKLEYKTQVIVFGEGGEMGDVIRNRLTHTLEVSQIATSLARTLGLNEDLASAIALAHDLGHTPFGHAGEAMLVQLVSSFNHNDHSLKIVRQLEHRYSRVPRAEPDGAHAGGHREARHAVRPHAYQPVPGRPGAQPGGAGGQHRRPDRLPQPRRGGQHHRRHPQPEDYHAAGVALWDEVWREMGSISDARVRLPQVTRRLINRMVSDVLAETARRLTQHAIAALEDVYGAQAVLVDFSDAMKPLNDALGDFLMARFYQDFRVLRGTAKGQMIIHRLFNALQRARQHAPPMMLLPPIEAADYREAQRNGRDRLGREALRVIADFLAGLTDREAYSLYVRLFEVGHGG